MSVARRRAGSGLRLVLAAAALTACSSDARYQVLSTLFDGVPAPGAGDGLSVGAVSSRARGPGTSPLASVHPPVRDGKCLECHPGPGIPPDTTPPMMLCIKCHTAKTEGMAWIHGPVATMVCTRCHDPHGTPYPRLTKLPGNDLCTQCHAHVLAEAAPHHAAVIDGSATCLSCHHAHGGQPPFMLRAPDERRFAGAPPPPAGWAPPGWAPAPATAADVGAVGSADAGSAGEGGE